MLKITLRPADVEIAPAAPLRVHLFGPRRPAAAKPSGRVAPPDAFGEAALFFQPPDVDARKASPPLSLINGNYAQVFRDRHRRADRRAGVDAQALPDPVLDFVLQVPDSRASVGTAWVVLLGHGPHPLDESVAREYTRPLLPPSAGKAGKGRKILLSAFPAFGQLLSMFCNSPPYMIAYR